jgi:hypothetical protein
VISIGCNRGADPTVQTSRVTDTDKVRNPPTTQVAGQPVVGRSGGGLFNTEGQVIGVCYAADPQDNEGLYAALSSVHAELDRRGLDFVYRQRPTGESVESRLANTRAPELPQALPSGLPPAQEAAALLGPKATLPASVMLTPVEYQSLTSEEKAVLTAVNSGNVSPQFLQQLALRSEKSSQTLTSNRTEPQGATTNIVPPFGDTPLAVPQRLSRSWGE